MIVVATSKDLSDIDETLHKVLQQYDLSGKVTFDSGEVKGLGAFSDVFRGNYTPTQMDVAIKRLRLFPKRDDQDRYILVSAVYFEGPLN